MNRSARGVLLWTALLVGSFAVLPLDVSAQAIDPPNQMLFPLLDAEDGASSIVDGFARGLSVGIWQAARHVVSTVRLAVKAWARYVRRGARWVAFAVVVAIFDRNLLAAWRASGLRVLTTYVPLMLYVNLRLFFDRRVLWLGKLLLLAALAYGIWRHDLVPDRSPFPGFLDDIVLVAIATRLLLAWSADDVVFEHASDAVRRWGRLAVPQRVRQR